MIAFNLQEMDVMHRKTVLVVGLGFLAVMVCSGASQADGRKAARTAAQTAGEHKAAHYRKRVTRCADILTARDGSSCAEVMPTAGPM